MVKYSLLFLYRMAEGTWNSLVPTTKRARCTGQNVTQPLGGGPCGPEGLDAAADLAGAAAPEDGVENIANASDTFAAGTCAGAGAAAGRPLVLGKEDEDEDDGADGDRSKSRSANDEIASGLAAAAAAEEGLATTPELCLFFFGDGDGTPSRVLAAGGGAKAGTFASAAAAFGLAALLSPLPVFPPKFTWMEPPEGILRSTDGPDGSNSLARSSV